MVYENGAKSNTWKSDDILANDFDYFNYFFRRLIMNKEDDKL
jgi:hypothetical protein